MRYRALAALALSVACTRHEAAPTEPVETDGAANGVVLGLRIDPPGHDAAPSPRKKRRKHRDQAAAPTCTVDVVDQSGTRVATLEPDDDGDGEAVEAKLAPGRYRLDDPRCGARGGGKAAGRKPLPFTVYEGKLSYLGDLVFAFDEERRWSFHYGDDAAPAPAAVAVALGTADEDDQSDGSGSAQAALDRPSSLHRLKSLPKRQRHALVSGYTGRKLVLEGRFTKPSDLTRIPPIASVTVGTLPAKPINLDACVDEERRTNPIATGSWRFQAHYRRNRLRKVEVETETHAYSTTFVACVRSALEAHKPGAPGLVSYEADL